MFSLSTKIMRILSSINHRERNNKKIKLYNVSILCVGIYFIDHNYYYCKHYIYIYSCSCQFELNVIIYSNRFDGKKKNAFRLRKYVIRHRAEVSIIYYFIVLKWKKKNHTYFHFSAVVFARSPAYLISSRHIYYCYCDA